MTEILRKEINNILKTNAEDSAQYLIGKEILNRLNNGLSLNSSEIASVTFTSKPTVTRFAQQFGFDGFKDFCKELLEQDKLYYEKPKSTDQGISYDKFDHELIKVIKDLNKHKDTIIDLANIILKNNRVFIISSPENIQLGNEFADRLRYLDVKVFNATYYDKQVFLSVHIKPGDLVLFLISGYDFDMETILFNRINDITTTALISTQTKEAYFKNPNYQISLNPGMNFERWFFKIYSIRYILDQIFNIIINTNQDLMGLIIDPKFKF